MKGVLRIRFIKNFIMVGSFLCNLKFSHLRALSFSRWSGALIHLCNQKLSPLRVLKIYQLCNRVCRRWMSLTQKSSFPPRFRVHSQWYTNESPRACCCSVCTLQMESSLDRKCLDALNLRGPLGIDVCN